MAMFKKEGKKRNKFQIPIADLLLVQKFKSESRAKKKQTEKGMFLPKGPNWTKLQLLISGYCLENDRSSSSLVIRARKAIWPMSKPSPGTLS